MQTPSPVAGDAPAAAEVDNRKVKTACCKTCGGWILMACFPDCETRPESRREFNKCIKAGDVIDVVTLAESQDLSYCECYKKKKGYKPEPDLFDEE